MLKLAYVLIVDQNMTYIYVFARPPEVYLLFSRWKCVRRFDFFYYIRNSYMVTQILINRLAKKDVSSSTRAFS